MFLPAGTTTSLYQDSLAKDYLHEWSTPAVTCKLVVQQDQNRATLTPLMYAIFDQRVDKVC